MVNQQHWESSFGLTFSQQNLKNKEKDKSNIQIFGAMIKLFNRSLEIIFCNIFHRQFSRHYFTHTIKWQIFSLIPEQNYHTFLENYKKVTMKETKL